MDVIMPQLGETVAEGTVTRWYKTVGDTIKADETLFDVETDKVSTEIPSPVAGVLAEIIVAEGATAKVGTRLAVIQESGSASRTVGDAPTEAAAAPTTAASAAGSDGSTRLAAGPRVPSLERRGADERLSPVVRRLLAEHTLDPHQINGTGRDGRITREDVLGYVARQGSPAGDVRTEERPSYVIGGADAEAVPLNSVRKRTAAHMTKSWTTIPHVLQVVEADFWRVDQARRAAGTAWKSREGYSLTYLPFIVRAVVLALGKFPRLNSSYQGDHLVLHKRVNVGIAVDLNLEGLVVPVLKDAASRSVARIAKEINTLSNNARASRLKPDDMTEATYTITNNGAFGTLITAPIISPPQVAILSTDSVKKRAVVVEGAGGDSIAVRPVGVLAQSFDHRAIDGAYSGSFLNEVKSIIETRDWDKELRA